MNDDEKPIFGWTNHSWKIAIQCVLCQSLIKEGIVRYDDTFRDSPSKAMCWMCFHSLASKNWSDKKDYE